MTYVCDIMCSMVPHMSQTVKARFDYDVSRIKPSVNGFSWLFTSSFPLRAADSVNIKILNAGAWSRSSEKVFVSLPTELEDLIPEVEDFYKRNHSGRKLHWHHLMSNGIVSVWSKAEFLLPWRAENTNLLETKIWIHFSVFLISSLFICHPYKFVQIFSACAKNRASSCLYISELKP